jgi:hypothetical protein
LPELNVGPDNSIKPQDQVAEDIPEIDAAGEGPGKALDITAAEKENTDNAVKATAVKEKDEPKAATKKPDVVKPADVEKKKTEIPGTKKLAGNKEKQASVKPSPDDKRNKSSTERTRQKT